MKRTLAFMLLVACKGAESPSAVEVKLPESGDAEILAMLSPDAEAALFGSPDAGVDSGHTAVDPLGSNLPAPSAHATGGLATDVVMRVVATHRSALRACYDAKLKRDPKYGGKIVVEWEITPGGRVSKVKTVSSTFPDPDVPSCIERDIAKWTFPQAATPTQIALPLAFVSAGP
jgi:hypothetical protein